MHSETFHRQAARGLRSAIAALAMGLLASGAMSAAARAQAPKSPGVTSDVQISARRLESYHRGIDGPKRFGRLEFRGGLVLSSEEQRFGGISGLIIAPDGKQFSAITDEGNWLTGEIAYAGRAPSGIVKSRMGPLLALNGSPLVRKRDADAEEMALFSGTLKSGIALVAFERNHRLVRYPIMNGALGKPTANVILPPDSRRMESNSGLEAVTVLTGGPNRGAIMALAEDMLDANGHHVGWLLGKGAPQTLTLTDIGGFSFTGAAAMDDGSVVILERRFRYSEGVRMRIRYVSAEDLKPGRVIEGETLIQSDMSYEIDNMEAIAVHKSPTGETVITVMSDDNFNKLLQRNLLLQFTLHPPGAKSTSR